MWASNRYPRKNNTRKVVISRFCSRIRNHIPPQRYDDKLRSATSGKPRELRVDVLLPHKRNVGKRFGVSACCGARLQWHQLSTNYIWSTSSRYGPGSRSSRLRTSMSSVFALQPFRCNLSSTSFAFGASQAGNTGIFIVALMSPGCVATHLHFFDTQSHLCYTLHTMRINSPTSHSPHNKHCTDAHDLPETACSPYSQGHIHQGEFGMAWACNHRLFFGCRPTLQKPQNLISGSQ